MSRRQTILICSAFGPVHIPRHLPNLEPAPGDPPPPAFNRALCWGHHAFATGLTLAAAVADAVDGPLSLDDMFLIDGNTIRRCSGARPARKRRRTR